MNAQRWGTMTAAAGADHYGQARVDGVVRRVYVDALRFVAPWPIPAPGDRVQLTEDPARGLVVLYVLGRGTPVGP